MIWGWGYVKCEFGLRLITALVRHSWNRNLTGSSRSISVHVKHSSIIQFRSQDVYIHRRSTRRTMLLYLQNGPQTNILARHRIQACSLKPGNVRLQVINHSFFGRRVAHARRYQCAPHFNFKHLREANARGVRTRRAGGCAFFTVESMRGSCPCGNEIPLLPPTRVRVVVAAIRQVPNGFVLAWVQAAGGYSGAWSAVG